jgi:protein SCO1
MFQTVFLKCSAVVLMLLLVSCKDKQAISNLPYYNTPDFMPVFATSKKEAAQQIDHRIGSFTFTDQNGNIISDKTIEGKIHVANFIFTSCGSICPVMTKHMKLLQTSFQNEPAVVMLSFSVTPWIDSVGRLKRFADNNDIVAPNWHLLTGNKGEIYQLARKDYFAEEDLGFTKDSSEFLHTEHVLLVDRSKRIRGIYNGTLQLEIEQLIKDIKQLAEER